jgi:hypothetical protein
MNPSHHEPKVNLLGPAGHGSNEPSASGMFEASHRHGMGKTLDSTRDIKDGYPDENIFLQATISRSHLIHFSNRRSRRSSSLPITVSSVVSFHRNPACTRLACLPKKVFDNSFTFTKH